MGRVEEFIGSNHQGSVNCGEGSVDFVENSRGTKSLLYLRFVFPACDGFLLGNGYWKRHASVVYKGNDGPGEASC